MHARSAVVDLYGDHLRRHQWWAPVSGIVALCAAVDVRPPATRTAISRLAAQGWLAPRPGGGVRGYAATPRARDRWQRAHERIYAVATPEWDGRWHVVHVAPAGDRRVRDQVARTLAYLGYGRLGGGGWVSPRPSPELPGSLEPLGVEWVATHGHLEPHQDPRALATRVWDLDDLAAAHRQFTSQLLPHDQARVLGPEEAYRERTMLVHSWRRFLFQDPQLPAQVLPEPWPGDESRDRFLQLATLLSPGADQHVADLLAAAQGAPVTRG